MERSTDRITWLGHAAVLIELSGTRLLTDPMLRRRVAHLRRRGPPVAPPQPPPDAVLISHMHRDHLDLPSLRRLGRVPVIVPRGAGALLRRAGAAEVIELREGETATIGGVRVEATPAAHRGGRRGGRHHGPAIGYLAGALATVYFAGDTDLFPGMAHLGSDLDLALLPVWGWGYRLGPGHMDPRRAAEALRLLRPRMAVPIHWGTLAPVWASRRRPPPFLTEPGPAFARESQRLAAEVEVHVLSPSGAAPDPELGVPGSSR